MGTDVSKHTGRGSRRQFLRGAGAGAVAAAVGEYLLPLEWRGMTFPLGTKLSFGQFGEDLIVVELLKGFGVEKPTYLDIGAYSPIIGSNTYMMYRAGGRGVLVEPNVDLIRNLESVRPRDAVLNVGIGFTGEESVADFYVMSYPQLNTFDGTVAERHVRDSGGAVEIKRVVKMPLIPVNRVLAEHFREKSPDFMSVDTEGLDLSILKTCDLKRYRPKAICAETLGHDGVKMTDGITALLEEQGYVLRGMTFANTIYVDRQLL